MCGGTLEIATCSHVGHVFRKSTPYTFPGGTSKIVNHNNARLAEVWLDQWKYFYYNINPGSTNTSWRTKNIYIYISLRTSLYTVFIALVALRYAWFHDSEGLHVSPLSYFLLLILTRWWVLFSLFLSDTR